MRQYQIILPLTLTTIALLTSIVESKNTTFTISKMKLEESTSEECIINDFLHFQRIKIVRKPSKKVGGIETRRKDQTQYYKATNSEVHFNLCESLSQEVLDICNIKSDRTTKGIFFLSIENSSKKKCRAVSFDQILSFDLKGQNLMIRFQVGYQEFVIQYPPHRNANSDSKANLTYLGGDNRRPIKLGFNKDLPLNFKGDSILAQGGYYWIQSSSSLVEYSVFLVILTIFLIFFFLKSGQIFFKRIRPFDFMINYTLFFFIVDFLLKFNKIYQKDFSSVIVLIIPFLISTTIDFFVPCLTKYFTLRKTTKINLRRILTPLKIYGLSPK